MVLDKKIVTTFVITSFVLAGTALASYATPHTDVKLETTAVISTEKTAVTVTTAIPHTILPPVQIYATPTVESPEKILADAILRILGFTVSETEITAYKSRNLGYGEITLAYNLASASGQSVDRILEMRFAEKMGWGKIAKVLGVKLHDNVDHSVYILREAKFTQDADTLVIQLGNSDRDDEDENEHKNQHESKSADPDDHHNKQGHDDKGKHKGNK